MTAPGARSVRVEVPASVPFATQSSGPAVPSSPTNNTRLVAPSTTGATSSSIPLPPSGAMLTAGAKVEPELMNHSRTPDPSSALTRTSKNRVLTGASVSMKRVSASETSETTPPLTV